MNLPNKLTLLRFCLVPVFLLFIYLTEIPYSYMIALVIFAVASATDALDGHIARKNNLVTSFGKFLDPLADKVLVISALVVLVDLNIMSAIPLIIIIAREFMVSGLRLVVADEGVVVPAGIWGKLKTAFTMVTIIFALVWLSIVNDFTPNISANTLDIVDGSIQALIWVSTVLTVISGLVYLKAFWKYIDTDK
ncbi:MAG TPA: CDP-diacylglycerol--glycerol-3-phosphate 3-phosphatidyltransferase [Clostridiales bacterium]|nr:CDP-diacylglycerol--glycerol-3-phosphate 3-phosphatidyltransferase [Clostridiales bacterium]